MNENSSDFCFVVTRREWSEQFGGMFGGEFWENQELCRVFREHNDAKKYCEDEGARLPYYLEWKGDNRYSGVTSIGGLREGTAFIITCVPLV